MRRQVSPHDWMSTSVSRPLTVVVVYSGLPERTCRQASLLLPGCTAWRSCSALTGSSGIGPGPCCASAALAISSDSKRNSSLISVPRVRTLLPDAPILVLCELTLLERLFPALLVARRPLAAAQLSYRRRVLPRLR